MKCRTCGGTMETKSTDLPFKVGESAIVIIKDSPSFNVLNVANTCSLTR
jgi:hypothetical protein